MLNTSKLGVGIGTESPVANRLLFDLVGRYFGPIEGDTRIVVGPNRKPLRKNCVRNNSFLVNIRQLARNLMQFVKMRIVRAFSNRDCSGGIVCSHNKGS